MGIVVIEEIDSKPYEILTVKQFASMASVSEANILNMTRKLDNKGEETMLDRCYPFSVNEDDMGPLFIPMNKKAEKYLQKRKGKEKRVNKRKD